VNPCWQLGESLPIEMSSGAKMQIWRRQSGGLWWEKVEKQVFIDEGGPCLSRHDRKVVAPRSKQTRPATVRVPTRNK
jgi:hypothetical protein